MIADKLWLGEPDCGEGQPDRPLRSPCHPPDGPCVPMKKPGYPAKPRSPKKDFCFDCPPKRPCNLNKCPPDDCEGTCGMANTARRNLLKLNSESQAKPAIKSFGASMWNRNRPRVHQANHQGVRNFCSSCDSKSPKDPPKKPESVGEPKVLYRKCPPLPKLPKLPECPKTFEAPKCPPPPKLPKCPEYPKPKKPKVEKSSAKTNTSKCRPSPSTKSKKAEGKFASNSDCHKERLEASSPLEGSLMKEHDDGRKDHPKESHCCATVPEKDVETKKNKSLWDKISEGTKRKMSTCHFQNSQRHFWTSGTFGSSFSSKSDPPSSDSHPQWKSRKCKTVAEVCNDGLNAKLEALECKPMDCPKKPNTSCYPEKPRCAEVRKPAERESEKDEIVIRKAKPSTNGDSRPPTIVKPDEKIDYTKRSCEPPTLLKLGPCPVSSPMKEDDLTSGASSKKLPEPPSTPVTLCRCPPPPKLHPGPCPCCDEYPDSPNIITKPCEPKPKYSCPETRVFYCPPKDSCKNEKRKMCNDQKNQPSSK